MNKFEEFRNKYSSFIYDSYNVSFNNEDITINFKFIIDGLTEFNPSLVIPKNIIKIDINNDFLNKLVFNLGMVEAISYYKATCSKKFIVNAGYLDDKQQQFFKKLFYLGLGEFLYTNNIEISMDDLFDFEINCDKEKDINIKYNGIGNLVPVGGGKDSCVSLELLKDMDNTCFAINPKSANKKCINVSGRDSIFVKRNIDSNLFNLNTSGYLNGHTPFSAIVAFTSYIVAYLSNKRYIVLSNEGSANEPTIIGTNINHQYSKSYEFECDFNQYTKDYYGIDIEYFSFLRPISELEIAKIFANIKKYHNVFRSCNVGSKNDEWVWCGKCPKCLFVYIILSPFLDKEELINIFGKDLYEDEDLLNTFIELNGYANTKPFECVGTYSECRYAVSLVMKKYDKLPYLLQYYVDNYELVNDYNFEYNKENNLPKEFENILKEELIKYDR